MHGETNILLREWFNRKRLGVQHVYTCLFQETASADLQPEVSALRTRNRLVSLSK